MRLSGKRILVTGGTGFIGSHLCDALLLRDAEVLCLGDLSSGQRSNITHLEENPRFQLLHHDVCEPLCVEVDEIYNLACPASPHDYKFDPVKTTKTSVLGAIHMLDLARRTGARILQASTGEIYGNPLIQPQHEAYWGNVNPIGVRSCYEEGKRCAETLFFDYHRQYGLKIKVARIFNTYGPRMSVDGGRVVSTFIVQSLLGEPLILSGTGEQVRSFCYVAELVDALQRLMATGDDVTGPMNLGSPHEITIRSLAEKVVKLSGSRSPIHHGPLSEGDYLCRLPDISLADHCLDWTPSISLDQGLEQTIAYFREHLTGFS